MLDDDGLIVSCADCHKPIHGDRCEDCEPSAVSAGSGPSFDWDGCRQTICDALQLMNGWKTDAQWTDWDESVRQRMGRLLEQAALQG